MKKIFCLLIIISSFIFSSCEKDVVTSAYAVDSYDGLQLFNFVLTGDGIADEDILMNVVIIGPDETIVVESDDTWNATIGETYTLFWTYYDADQGTGTNYPNVSDTLVIYEYSNVAVDLYLNDSEISLVF